MSINYNKLFVEFMLTVERGRNLKRSRKNQRVYICFIIFGTIYDVKREYVEIQFCIIC